MMRGDPTEDPLYITYRAGPGLASVSIRRPRKRASRQQRRDVFGLAARARAVGGFDQRVGEEGVVEPGRRWKAVAQGRGERPVGGILIHPYRTIGIRGLRDEVITSHL